MAFITNSNNNVQVLASAARVASENSPDMLNGYGKGLHLVIDMTAVTATGAVTFTVQGKDEVSGKYYTLLASAALAAVATTVLRVYPALTAAANLTANDVLPRTWRVIATHGNAVAMTYSVGASVIE